MDEALCPALTQLVRVLYLHHNLSLHASDFIPVTTLLPQVNPEECPRCEERENASACNYVEDGVSTHLAGSVAQFAFQILLWARIARLVRSSIVRMSASVTRMGFTHRQEVSIT